MYNNWKDWKAK